jgi:hypothetical protein
MNCCCQAWNLPSYFLLEIRLLQVWFVVVDLDSSSIVPVAQTNRDSFIPFPHVWRNKDCTFYVQSADR